jgi:hypothetical protein
VPLELVLRGRDALVVPVVAEEVDVDADREVRARADLPFS